MLVTQKWLLAFLKVLQSPSILKDVECTDMHSGLLAGKYLSDYLIFAAVSHDQLICSSVSCSSERRGVDSDGMLVTEKGGGGVSRAPFIDSDHLQSFIFFSRSYKEIDVSNLLYNCSHDVLDLLFKKWC
jgi:hypothetical protein